MWNYQWADISRSFLQIVQTVKDHNISRSAETAYGKVHSVYDFIWGLPVVTQVTGYLGDTLIFTELSHQWQLFYDQTYEWLYPTVYNICNSSLHYGTGVSVGILASLLLFIFILTRLMPQRLKSLGYLFMFLGSSASLWFLSVLGQMTNEPLADRFLEYWQYIFGYFIISGVISFAIMYRYGPVSDQRTLNLIQWFLQCIGLILIYNSSQIREVSIVMIIVVLIIYNFPRAIFRNQRVKNYWQRIFPPKIKVLTEEEYIREGNEQTKKELEKLRDFCRSPDCQAWKIISRLKSPQRFADFVEGNSWHVSNDELLDYDSGPDPTPPHLLTDDEEEEEIDFMLNSP